MLECYKQAPRNMMNWTVLCHIAVVLVIINIVSLYMSPWTLFSWTMLSLLEYKKNKIKWK